MCLNKAEACWLDHNQMRRTINEGLPDVHRMSNVCFGARESDSTVFLHCETCDRMFIGAKCTSWCGMKGMQLMEKSVRATVGKTFHD